MIKMEIEINDIFECTKPQGKPGERCGKQCVWFNIGDNIFMICKFFNLKKEYVIYKK